ncbi:MAG: hypothetical protein PHE86_01205 [Candidatus Marinimicrobia bacterium]|nr:hypothetical protein [Candidatus Neomarinimicrobiota bacterium]
MDSRFSRIKYLFLGTIFLLMGHVSARSDTWDALLDRYVITEREIETAGIYKLSDLFLLIHPSYVSTTDGYTWQLSMVGLSSFQHQQWKIMIDGMTLNVTAMGIKNINMLPVSISQIDSVEIVTTPQIYEGTFIQNGVIHIHTKKPEPGTHFLSTLSMGNETKDPGPYRYTDMATPNVDKLGRDVTGNLSYGKNSDSFTIGLIYQEYMFTDFRIKNRVKDIAYDWPNMNFIASTVNAYKKSDKKLIHFLGSYGQAHHYFLFFKPLGREVPVNYHVLYSGINIESQMSKQSQRTVTFNYEMNYPQKYKNTQDIDFLWQMHTFNARIEHAFKRRNFFMKVGIRDELNFLQTSYQIDKKSYHLMTFYKSTLFMISPHLSQKIDLSLSSVKNNLAFKSALTTCYHFPSKNELALHVSYSQRLFEENNSLWYWTNQGYYLLEDIGIDYHGFDSFENSTHTTLDLTWHSRSAEKVSYDMSGFYRQFHDLMLEKQRFLYKSENCTFFSPIECVHHQKGSIGGIDILVRNRLLSTVYTCFYYRYQQTLGGSDLFKETWESIPDHKLSFQLIYTPVENFSLWGIVTYYSPTEWKEYNAIDGTECLVDNQIYLEYSSKVHNDIAFDVEVQKWFWHRKLMGSLTLRNLLDHELIYHPIGAGFDLSLYIKLTLLI